MVYFKVDEAEWVGWTLCSLPTAQEMFFLCSDLKLSEGARPPLQRARSPPRSAACTSATAGISSSAADAAPLSPPPAPPAADGRGGGAEHDDEDNDIDTCFPLLDLLERFPDLFALKVLAHLDPIDRTFLAQTGSACRAAVAASDLPRAGTRREVLGRSVWVVQHRLREFVGSVEQLAWAKNSGCTWNEWTCMLAARGGRLEVLMFARENDCPWDAMTCEAGRSGRAPRGVAVGAGAWLPVG